MNYYGYKNQADLTSSIKKMLFGGMLQKEISAKLGCSKPTIIKLFRSLNIEMPPRFVLYRRLGFKTDDEMKQQFAKLYDAGLSQAEIAKQYETSVNSVSQCLKRHKIKARNASFAAGVKQKDIALSAPETSVLCGILLGNANLYMQKYTAFLRYACLHKDAMESITETLRGLNPIYTKKMARYELKTMSFICLADLYQLWYEEDTKRLPADLSLTNEVAYWWYVGDGASTLDSIKIYTSVDEKDMHALIDKMPVKSEWYKAMDRFPAICIDKSDREKFLEFIGPCRHPAYAYKWKIYAK